MVQTILVPLDGSREAEVALTPAGALAIRLNARVLLVRPVDVRALPSQNSEEHRACRAARARAYLHEAASRVREDFPTLHIGAVAPFGVAPWAILDEAQIEHTDLIVCATHFGDDATRRRVGRVAEALTEQTSVPVLLIPQAARTVHDIAPPGRPLRILVPLSGTATAEAVLPFVTQLAARVKARVTVLHVVAAGDVQDGVTGELHPRSLQAAEHARYVRRRLTWATAVAYCRRVVGWLEQHGVRADLELRSGSVTEEIGIAALERVDVIALSTVGGLPQPANETVHQVLQRAARSGTPVLLVRAHRAEVSVLALAADSSHGYVAGAGHADREQKPPLRDAQAPVPHGAAHAVAPGTLPLVARPLRG